MATQDIQVIKQEINQGTTAIVLENFDLSSAAVRLGAQNLSPDVSTIEKYSVNGAYVIGEGEQKKLNLIGKETQEVVNLKSVGAIKITEEALRQKNFSGFIEELQNKLAANIIAAVDNAVLKGYTNSNSTSRDAVLMREWAPLNSADKVAFDPASGESFITELIAASSFGDFQSGDSNIALSPRGFSTLQTEALDKNSPVSVNAISRKGAFDVVGLNTQVIKGLSIDNFAPASKDTAGENSISNGSLALVGDFSSIQLAIDSIQTKIFTEQFGGEDLSGTNHVVIVLEAFFRATVDTDGGNFTSIVLPGFEEEPEVPVEGEDE